jgi:hypothetical protein
MKVSQTKLVVILSILGWVISIIGCKNETVQPLWDKKSPSPQVPVITRLDPDSAALPGVNKIKIFGKNLNLGEALSDDQVYFDNVKTDVIEGSDTSLTVLRPNIVGDSISVNVSSLKGIGIARHGPYRVDPVMDQFINSALQMDAIEIDRNENLYFVERLSLDIYQVTPGRTKAKVGTARSIVSDIKFAPSGKLLIFSQSTSVIDQLDITTGTRTPWVYLVNRLGFCDFDVNGNLYVGGLNRSLYVVRPDTSRITVSGYNSDNIISLRVCNGYVYILTASSVIWRNQILNATGSLGTKEKVLDLTSGGFPASPQKITFSASGLLYIASDDTLQRTVVTYDLTNQQLETVYKGIIPNSPPVKFVWGTGNLLYMLTSTGSNWIIVRIDAGAPSAPYYGR